MTISHSNRPRSRSGFVRRFDSLRDPVWLVRFAALAAFVSVLATPGFGTPASVRVAHVAASRHVELASLLAVIAAVALGAWALGRMAGSGDWPRPRARSLAFVATVIGCGAALALIVADFATLPVLAAPTDAAALAAKRHDFQHAAAY